MEKLSLEEKIQRALDYQEIQNVMGRHEYYHSAGMHKEEFEALFAQKTPGVSFTENGEAWIGTESVRNAYVNGIKAMGKANLKDMRKLFPEIENHESNNLIGMCTFHTLTTPVIEIAEDAKTAKGVWYSPGFITAVMNGKLNACWVWEKYGVDFVKEDGKWKIWHLHMYTDFLTPYNKSWVENSLEQRSAGAKHLEGFPEPDKSGVFYKQYSPKTVPQYIPKPPEPYKTFDEKTAY